MTNMNYNNNLYDGLRDALARANEYDNSINRWVKQSDMMRMENMEGDNEANYDQLFNIAADILSHIPESEFQTNEGMNFLDEFNGITNDIISYTLSNPVFWQVDLNDKFVWIALMVSIKTCQPLVKYLIKMASEQTLLHEDNHNCNTFMVACNNIPSLIELIDASSVNHVYKTTNAGVSPFNLLCYTGTIVQLINENKISVDMVLASVTNNNNKMSALHFAAMQNQINPHTLEFLLDSGKVTETHLLTQDINGNTPLHIACIHKADKATHMIIKSKIFTTANILSIKNNASQTVLTYQNTHIIKYILEYGCPKIDNQIFIDMKLYTMINKYNVLNMISSGILTPETCLIPLESANINDGSNCVIDYLLANKDVINLLFGSTDEKIKDFIKTLTTLFDGFLSLLIDFGMDIAQYFIESEYIEDFHFTGTHMNKTIFQKILFMSKNTRYVSMQPLITAILDCPKVTIINDKEFISLCVDRFSTLFSKLIEKGHIKDNIADIISTLLADGRVDAVQTLFNDKLVKPEHLRENYGLVSQLININEKYLEFMIDNDLFDMIIIMWISNNNDEAYTNSLQINLPYTITSDECFIKLIKDKNYTTELLNAVEPNHEGIGLGILKEVYELKKLSLLLELRPDFDVTLLFTNFLYSKFVHINIQDIPIIKEVINHNNFTEEYYNKLFDVVPVNKIFTNKEIGTFIINHKFFNKNVFKYEYDQNKNNLLGFLINLQYDVNIIMTVIDKDFVDTTIITYLNKNNENILIIASNANRHDVINLITENKKFTNVLQQLVTQKTSDNITMLEKLFGSPNIKLIIKLITPTNNYDNSDILSCYPVNNENKTLLHQIFLKYNNDVKDVCELLSLFDVQKIKTLLTQTDSNNTSCLTIMMSKYKTEDIILILTLVDDLTLINPQNDNVNNVNNVNNMTPLMSLIMHNKNSTIIKVVEYILSKNVLNYDNMSTPLIKSVIKYCQQLLTLFEEHNIDIEKLLSKIDINNDPLYFQFTDCEPLKFNTDKYYTQNSMHLKNSRQITLVDYILSSNKILLIKTLIDRNLINNTMIPDMKNITEYNSELLDVIINDDKFSELFNEANMVTYISSCITKLSDNIKILTRSKYFNDNVLQKMEKSLLHNMCNSYTGIKYIFDNELTTESFIKMNNYALVRSMNNPQYLKRLIGQIQLDLLCKIRFENDGTILHKLSLYPNLIKYFLNKDNSSDFEKLLLEVNNKNETFMHLLIVNEYILDIQHILTLYDGNEIISALFDIQDISNDNCLMLISRSTQIEIQNLFVMMVPYIILSPDLLNRTDHNGTSLLSLVSKFVDTDLWKQLINKTAMNNLLDTIEILTIVNNTQNLQILLDNTEIVEKYNNFTRCFALACRYSPGAIKLLLKTNKIDLCNCYDIIKIRDENGVENYIANYVQIACRYNPDCLRELLNTVPDLTVALHEINIDNKDNNMRHFNAFVLAIMFEPEAVRMLINSKYMTTEYIQQTSQIVQTSCLQFAFETQIASFSHMLMTQNNNFKKDPILNNQIPGIFGGQGSRVTYNSIHYQESPLFKHKDVMCATTDPHACSLCCSNHMKVIFSPCGHKSCVSCAIKLYTCPQCRADIKHKLIFN